MKRNLKKVIYFIGGYSPTQAELDDAEQYYNGKSNVVFRNVRYVHKDEALEAFDIVAGLVPENYAKAALAKGPDAIQATPIVDAATVPAGSPLASKEDGAAPKAPAAKPGADWKPNA